MKNHFKELMIIFCIILLTMTILKIVYYIIHVKKEQNNHDFELEMINTY